MKLDRNFGLIVPEDPLLASGELLQRRLIENVVPVDRLVDRHRFVTDGLRLAKDTV